MGKVDRIIRVLFAVLVTVLFFGTNVLSGIIGIVLLALSGIFLITSIAGFCPIYAIFGLSTCKMNKA